MGKGILLNSRRSDGKKKKIMDHYNLEGGIVGFAVACLIFAVILGVANISIEKSEKQECATWQDYAKEYQGFYLTKSESDQCNNWGIKVDAPVHE